MDQDLQNHIIDIKAMLGSQSSTLTALKNNLDHHIAADERKFIDLYERHRQHEEFKNRVKGTTKGIGLLATLAVGALAFWQQILEAFKP